MNVTEYILTPPRLRQSMTLAVAADLHGRPFEDILETLRTLAPDAILIPGDLMEDGHLFDPAHEGYTFLRAAAAIAPTYYSLGNHEMGCYHRGNHFAKPLQKPIPEDLDTRVADTGAHLLDNTHRTVGDISFCGLRSGLDGKRNAPDPEALRRFDSLPGVRVLLCHHPEYYAPYLKSTSIELIVSGHAHGGQWRIFGRGVYAPGQGLFPRYTSGVTDGRFVISRGLGNHTHIPRIFNPPELLLLRLEPQKP